MDIFLYFSAIVIIAFVPIFLWNLWLAPYRLMEDRLDKAVSEGKVLAHTCQKPEPVDVSLWDGTSGFKLGDAACLWAEICPHEPIISSNAKAKFAQLCAAMMREEIPYPVVGFSNVINFLGAGRQWPEYDQWVSAIDLRKYADSIDEVPEFLQSVDVPDAQELLE